MKAGLKTNLGLFVIFMTLCHLTTFCSKKLHHQTASHKAEINDPVDGNDPSGQSDIDRYERIEKQSRRRLQDFRKSAPVDTVNKNETLADSVLKTAIEYLGVPYCF